MAKKPKSKRPAPKRSAPAIKSVVHLASPPNTIPLVVHDPIKNLVTIAHVEPERIGWFERLFGSGKR